MFWLFLALVVLCPGRIQLVGNGVKEFSPWWLVVIEHHGHKAVEWGKGLFTTKGEVPTCPASDSNQTSSTSS